MGVLKRLMSVVLSGRTIPYAEAKKLARDADMSVRMRLAARGDVRPEILYFLAEDPAPEVRREIAANTAAPRQADLLLTRDADCDVRLGLAAKIARLAPGLSADEQDRVRRATHEALEILARDEVIRVRQILSETLKDVADAPPDVIRRLAWDTELVVSGPVLEFSPVLTDEDLLEIIASNPANGALDAISCRSPVNAPVADAIVDTEDISAVAALLGNASAQIREETLDRVVERAVDIDPWHGPLVRRPHLSARAAARLTRVVADNLLEVLTQRHDLDAETAEAVRQEVRRRIEETEEGDEPVGRKGGRAGAVEDSDDETPLDAARRLHAAGNLDESAIAGALGEGRHEFVMAALAVITGLRLGAVEKIVSTQSAKGMVAMAWKAGLSMRCAVHMQQKLARIAPRDIVQASAGGDGHYPLSEKDMEWQLEFLADMGS